MLQISLPDTFRVVDIPQISLPDAFPVVDIPQESFSGIVSYIEYCKFDYKQIITF